MVRAFAETRNVFSSSKIRREYGFVGLKIKASLKVKHFRLSAFLSFGESVRFANNKDISILNSYNKTNGSREESEIEGFFVFSHIFRLVRLGKG